MCFLLCSELAQKTRAEREAKRALHEAGVAKKKEIVSNAVTMQAERKVIDVQLKIESRTMFLGSVGCT